MGPATDASSPRGAGVFWANGVKPMSKSLKTAFIATAAVAAVTAGSAMQSPVAVAAEK